MFEVEAGVVTRANAALARIFGYTTPAELVASGQLTSSGGWKTRDGKALQLRTWTVDSMTWVVDASTNPELQRATTTLDYVMKLAHGIYWCIDRKQRVVEVGGAMDDVLGYTGPGRYVGKTIAEHAQVEPINIDSTVHHVRALAGELVTFDSEYKGKMLTSALGPLRDADGNITGAVGVAIDVTRVRQLERRMIDAQRAESLGVLAGGLAHDFNNLLVAVIGSAEIALRDLPVGSAVQPTLESIRTAGLRAAELTAQLLAYAGRGGRGTTRIFPAAVVDELVRILAPSLDGHVTTTTDLPTDVSLRGDPGQFRQVVLNLITNARDAGAKTIAITARATVHDGAAHPDDALEAAAGDYISLVVTDDGPGFDRETRRHVFEPFFTTKATGHGLGLATVLGIVRAHAGGIRVTATPGAGASFEILWPAAHQRGRTNPSSAPPVNVPGRTVLVVDDEDLVRDVVARMLAELGYTPMSATDGASALALLEEGPVDAVLVDLTMPQMSGTEVVATIRQRWPGLPVVVCSGFDRGGTGPAAGDAYLAKPFRIEALERTLAKLLPLRSV
jgi:signal transduction histidine kinase/CheY-like chemotaxis protein